jgi:putative acetyltransferase
MDRPRASAVASAVTIRRAQPQEHEALVQLWLRSVTATHAFLQPGEIEALLPAVRERALPALNLWVLAAGDGRILGFLGLTANSVEALFIEPDSMRRGHGRRLLDLARRLQGAARTPLRVDVNEQNPEAVKFYEACGFKVTRRSPVDSAGRPYPLLHMEETAKP